MKTFPGCEESYDDEIRFSKGHKPDYTFPLICNSSNKLKFNNPPLKYTL